MEIPAWRYGNFACALWKFERRFEASEIGHPIFSR